MSDKTKGAQGINISKIWADERANFAWIQSKAICHCLCFCLSPSLAVFVCEALRTDKSIWIWIPKSAHWDEHLNGINKYHNQMVGMESTTLALCVSVKWKQRQNWNFHMWKIEWPTMRANEHQRKKQSAQIYRDSRKELASILIICSLWNCLFIKMKYNFRANNGKTSASPLQSISDFIMTITGAKAFSDATTLHTDSITCSHVANNNFWFSPKHFGIEIEWRACTLSAPFGSMLEPFVSWAAKQCSPVRTKSSNNGRQKRYTKERMRKWMPKEKKRRNGFVSYRRGTSTLIEFRIRSRSHLHRLVAILYTTTVCVFCSLLYHSKIFT